MPRPKKKSGSLFVRKNEIPNIDPAIPRENVLSLRKKIWEIKIDPQAIKNFFHIHRHPLMIISGVVIILSILSVSFHTEANVATFYPKSCLGGWENVAGAEGEADVKDTDDLKSFTKQNSAVLKDSTAEIFCGGFEGEVPEDATPKRFSIMLSWSVDDGTLVHDEPAPFETVPEENTSPEPSPEPTSPPDPLPSTGEGEEIPTTNVEEITVEEGPDIPLPLPIESNDENAFFQIIPKALAQEESVVAEPAPEIPTETLPVENTSETTEEVSEVENPSSEVIVEEAESSPVAQDNFMEIRYTLDGKEWKSLAMISKSDWQKGEFDISDSALEGWADLSLLQISLTPIVTIDTSPVVYLDAISLNVEYSNAVDDVLAQPDFLNDEVYIDKTVENIRVIKIKRDGEPMIWYTTVSQAEEEVETETQDETPEENTEPLPETEVTEPVTSLFFKTAFAQEVEISEPEPTSPPAPLQNSGEGEIPTSTTENVSESEITQETPIEETPMENTEEPVETINTTIENILPDTTIFPDSQKVEDVPTYDIVPIKYTKSDINKERNKKLEWTLVARGKMVDSETTVDITGGKIFWFAKGKTALYEYNTASSGISSQTVDIDENSEVKYFEPNGDESILKIQPGNSEIITPSEDAEIKEILDKLEEVKSQEEIPTDQ
jgi:hypothetical protein